MPPPPGVPINFVGREEAVMDLIVVLFTITIVLRLPVYATGLSSGLKLVCEYNVVAAETFAVAPRYPSGHC